MSTLEDCMPERDGIRTDGKGNSSTIMVRDRIQDVAYHVVHFQEAMQDILATHTRRLATLEQLRAACLDMHNITPKISSHQMRCSVPVYACLGFVLSLSQVVLG